MAAADTEIRDETEVVEAWRGEQLELAGYGAAAAAELAARHEVDLHVAIEMIAQGCPPELALKILI